MRTFPRRHHPLVREPRLLPVRLLLRRRDDGSARAPPPRRRACRADHPASIYVAGGTVRRSQRFRPMAFRSPSGRIAMTLVWISPRASCSWSRSSWRTAIRIVPSGPQGFRPLVKRPLKTRLCGEGLPPSAAAPELTRPMQQRAVRLRRYRFDRRGADYRPQSRRRWLDWARRRSYRLLSRRALSDLRPHLRGREARSRCSFPISCATSAGRTQPCSTGHGFDEGRQRL